MEQAERKRAELTLSDRSELRALRDYLSWAAPGVRVLQLPGRERAVLDQLTLLGTGDDIVTVVKLLPEFLSRRTDMSVTIIVEGTPVTLTDVNLDEILPPLARLLALRRPRGGGPQPTWPHPSRGKLPPHQREPFVTTMRRFTALRSPWRRKRRSILRSAAILRIIRPLPSGRSAIWPLPSGQPGAPPCHRNPATSRAGKPRSLPR